MKNTGKLFLLFLLLFAFTACSSDNISDTSSVAGGEESSLEGFGQPERTAEVNGVIKSITGNLITVAIVERQTGENTEEANTEDAAAVGVTSTNIPGSGSGGGGGGSKDSAVSDADRLAKLLERSTGQESVTVPVGIAMTKFSEVESEDREKVEAILSDLSAGQMVSVWLNQDIPDRKVAEFVSIK